MNSAFVYTTEPMATRALAAEIRHDSSRVLELLRQKAQSEELGVLRRVRCEAVERVDVLLECEREDGAKYTVGIEAKFDHELSRDQVERLQSALDLLFILIPDASVIPMWLHDEYPAVPVIRWTEILECFVDSRLTLIDIAAIKVPKVAIEARFAALTFGDELDGWAITIERNGSGNPSLIFESPELPDGRTLRGQIQVVGRGVPALLEEVRVESHIGIEVAEDESNYFDPDVADFAPPWIEDLKILHKEVLAGNEDQLLISRRAPGHSKRELGRWKKPLAQKYLGGQAYLAKGYTDGWAIGPKTEKVHLEDIDRLAAITADVFRRWFEAAHRGAQPAGRSEL